MVYVGPEHDDHQNNHLPESLESCSLLDTSLLSMTLHFCPLQMILLVISFWRISDSWDPVTTSFKQVPRPLKGSSSLPELRRESQETSGLETHQFRWFFQFFSYVPHTWDGWPVGSGTAPPRRSKHAEKRPGGFPHWLQNVTISHHVAMSCHGLGFES